jgi:hypothetical protein
MNKRNPENVDLLRAHEENEEREFHRLLRGKRMWNPETGLFDLSLEEAERRRLAVEKEEHLHNPDGENWEEFWQAMQHKLAGIKNDPAS